jgi:uncharacterized membrane protein YdjX (TVP38/TMEM64 family)
MLRAGKQSGSPFAIATLEHGLLRNVHAGMAKMFSAERLLSLIDYERWQDVVLAAGNIFFCFTLIPMLRYPVRPPLLTCIPTGLALLIGGFVFATLHLWLTAATQTVTGLQWLFLVFKRPLRKIG